jgi:hypothetical protein
MWCEVIRGGGYDPLKRKADRKWLVRLFNILVQQEATAQQQLLPVPVHY